MVSSYLIIFPGHLERCFILLLNAYESNCFTIITLPILYKLISYNCPYP